MEASMRKLTRPAVVLAFAALTPLSTRLAAQAPDVSRVREAATRGFALVQATQKQSLTKQFCSGTCHLQVMGAFAYKSMKEHGLPVDEAAAKADALKAFGQVPGGALSFALQDYPGGEPGIGASFMVAAHALGSTRTVTTAAMGRVIALVQQPAGDWTSFHVRAPSSYSSFTFTAYSLRAMQLLTHPSQKEDVAKRVARARHWLGSHQPRETEDRTFQLLGLLWAGADAASLKRLGQALAATQRKDGGWNSLDGRDSDAYSTGQALVALFDAAGVPASDPVYQRGLAFLVNTQAADGSWHTTTRLPPFVNPPYFESGYPYGRDQFISVAGANWAVMALTRALGPVQPIRDPLPLDVKDADVEPWVESVMFGSSSDVKRLLDNGLDPNATAGGDGLTPLMLAAPDADKMRLLLDRGANVGAQTRQHHYSALTIAAQYPEGNAAVRLLLQRGARPRVPSGAPAPAGAVSPFFLASILGDPALLPLLRDRPETLREPGNVVGVPLTPLAGATIMSRMDAVRALIALGADVNEGDNPPLLTAALGYEVEIARLLIASGADVQRFFPFPMPGTTALHLASYIDQRDDQMIKLLLDAGARADARDEAGQTALDIAEKRHNAHLIPALRAASAAAQAHR
jgi:ankyrin repeat protein